MRRTDLDKVLDPSERMMARFAGRKDKLLGIWRDACPTSKPFDAEAAWRELEIAAFAVLHPEPPRRTLENAMTKRRAERLSAAFERSAQVGHCRDAIRELGQLVKALETRPKGRQSRDTGLLRAVKLLAVFYRNRTGRVAAQPSTVFTLDDTYIGAKHVRRGDRGFPALVAEFMVATRWPRRLSAEGIRKLIRQARRTRLS